MSFLASDTLRGRGSASNDEAVAAAYIASQLQQYGVKPGANNGGYIEAVTLSRRQLTVAPKIEFKSAGAAAPAVWTHGSELLAVHIGQSTASGPLQKVELGSPMTPKAEAFVLLTSRPGQPAPTRSDALHAAEQGASVVFLPETSSYREHWKAIEERVYSESYELAGEGGPSDKSVVLVLAEDAYAQLQKLPDGTAMRFEAPGDAQEEVTTHNVIGKITGRNPRLSAILFSAHMDHLGTGKAGEIYNGADDDASGVAAVLELARVLGKGPRPRRTVYFACFGSEELGELGATYFARNPPAPLNTFAAGLEFEMIGRRDPSVARDTLWLTGWPRSNLGPTLAAHGARLVGDPHPDQHFFERSDNYALAAKGVIAQTVSSFGLHADYHQPTDKVDRIDFVHMERAIGSLIAPLQWLVNSDFRPRWNPGQQP